jgi:putative toxin-antitoxin system antitoxin component (TIGR02293 family)
LKRENNNRTPRVKKVNHLELIRRQAEQVFGNKAKADLWLNQPKTAFGGVTPLELAHTEEGYELVKAELEKLSHGYAC